MREHSGANISQLNKNMLRSAGRQITAFLSLFVVLGVFWCLKLTGITLAGEAFCGMEEHQHGENCLTRRLICELEEMPGHTHDDTCLVQQLVCKQEEILPHVHDESCLYKEFVCTEEEWEGHVHDDSCRALILTCTAEEQEGHQHGDTCYTPGEDFVCGQEESEGHSHGEQCYVLQEDHFVCGMEVTEGHVHTGECYAVSDEYSCGLVEEGHVHTEECYETVNECPLEEHIHVESCYSNIDADLETDEDWEVSVGELPEGLTTGETLAAVARTQLGYKESELNFEVDLHSVRRGITRYGQWYGNPYGDWSAMFVSFCLHYADVEDLPANAGPESMRLEWEAEGRYLPAAEHEPRIGDLIFLAREEEETASAVAIVTGVDEEGITVIQGDFENMVAERQFTHDDPAILGYGLVPENSPYTVMMSPRATELSEPTWLGRTIDFNANMFTDDRSFVIYAEYGEGLYYALVSNPANSMETSVVGVPIAIDESGNIYTDVDDPDTLLWNFTRNGNNYIIKNVATGRLLHPGGDNGVIYNSNATWPTALSSSGTGAKFRHTSENKGVYFNIGQERFEIVSRNNASTLYLGVSERCTVWLDGTDGGLSSFGGSQTQSFRVDAMSQMTLPVQWLSPTKYSYQLRGWYDVTHSKYYAPGERVTITENTVFYADWMASTYDIGVYNAEVAHTVSTNSFITTQLFDYNYLFNILSADTTSVSISDATHSETWSIVQDENVEYEDRESLEFIFLDYGNGGTLDYPNNRVNGVNQYPGEDIVTGGIYNKDIGDALFKTDDHIPGKVYLGTGDHLFQIMDDESSPYHGYYYYDSARNAASYNQSDERFYVYDYLEATSAELSASKSDFLPLNSPYANKNGKQVGTYNADDEHADMTNYVYDAKFNDSSTKVSTNYAFGMKMDIRFYLPNEPGEGGNQDLYGNDMRFTFSGDDDLWVLVDGKLALDIGGIHQAESGEINFSTGDVYVQGDRNDALSQVVSALPAGEHTLTVMYLERGASHSNCAIYFNLAPRYGLRIQKEDVLSRDVLNGAEFSIYSDVACDEEHAVKIWESEESFLRGDTARNTFKVVDGVASMWGLGAGNTYYIKETAPPSNPDYTGPNGIIRMILDKKGAAAYNVLILEEGEAGVSGGFTVHGFQVDEKTQEADIVATNAPKWVEDVTTVEARKFWDDGKDHSGEEVVVYLTIQDPDNTVRRLQEAHLNEENDWHHVWENLPKYYQDKTDVVYGVEEAYVTGYYSKTDKLEDTATEYRFESSHWTGTTTLEQGRTYLLKTSNGCLSTQNRNSDTGFMWVDEAIAKESDLALWTVTTGNGGYKLTNKAGQTITFYYNGGSPTDFYASSGGESNAAKQYFARSVSGNQIRLYYDTSGTDYYLTGNRKNGQKLDYSRYSSGALLITPLTLEQTTVTKPREAETSYQIINTPLKKETSLTVSKQWNLNGGENTSLYEKEQVTVKLLADDKDTGRTVTLTLKNGWTDTFRGLPYEDDEGNVIEYTVEEVWNKAQWTTAYGEIQTSDSSPPTYSTVITNTYHPGGPMLPSTGTAARMLYVLGGAGIMLFSLIYGFVSRRKRERRTR